MKKMSSRFCLAILLCGLVAIATQAQEQKQDSKKKKDDSSKKDELSLNDIRSQMSKEQAEIISGIRKVKPGSKEYTELVNKYYGVVDKYADKILDAVKKDPKNRVGISMLTQLAQMSRSKDVRDRAIGTMLSVAKEDPKSSQGFQMLMMLVTGPVTPMVRDEAWNLLMENHGDSEKMVDVAMSMTRAPASKNNISMMRKLLEETDQESVKGAATYALGKMLFSKKETKEEGMKLIKSIPEKFKDVKVYGGRMNLADMVAGEIFEMEHLQIGMEVPEIEGEDVDGVNFKLSDYRGKVVVIDFWGDW